MGSVKFEKGSKEFQFFAEFWAMVQKYYIPEKNDEYWDSLDNDANNLANKYDDKLFDTLIIAFINSMAKKLEEGKRDDKRRNRGIP